MVAPNWKFREKVEGLLGAVLIGLNDLTLAAGDLLYASDVDTPAALPKGSARQILTMNSGGTAPEWTDPDGGRFDISAFIQGKPSDGELVVRHVFTGIARFRAGMPGSRSTAEDASTGTVVFSLEKNGTEFATITFTSSADGVFAAASDTDFAADDVLTIIAPASQDATLSDISISVTGGDGGVTDRFDLSLFVQSRPTDGELVARHICTDFISFPAGLTDSYSTAETASTGTVAFSLEKDGVEFGTVTFTTSATGVLAAASETVFSPGDLLTIIAPATRDATLADISITLTGTR